MVEVEEGSPRGVSIICHNSIWGGGVAGGGGGGGEGDDASMFLIICQSCPSYFNFVTFECTWVLVETYNRPRDTEMKLLGCV